MSTSERISAGINHTFAILTPAWRKTAYDLIAEQGSDQRTVCKILAACLALQAREQDTRTTEHHAPPAPRADTGDGQGQADGQAPPPRPCPPSTPPPPVPTTPTNTQSEHDDEHKE
jgi:hypothetical protein